MGNGGLGTQACNYFSNVEIIKNTSFNMGKILKKARSYNEDEVKYTKGNGDLQDFER